MSIKYSKVVNVTKSVNCFKNGDEQKSNVLDKISWGKDFNFIRF